MQIIFDTNVLLAIYQWSFDLFSAIEKTIHFSYEPAIVEETLHELEHLATTLKGKDKKAALVALQIIKAKNLKIIPSILEARTADDHLYVLADDQHIIVTQDKALKKRIREKPAPLIIIKNKKQPELINHVL